MKNFFCIFSATLSFLLLHAQYKVQFIVKEKTAIHHDSIYITGTFNNWDSTANKTYLMRPYGANEKSIILNLTAGPLRYKFTRGSWLGVEKQNYGDEVPDRIIPITRDTTIRDSEGRWASARIISTAYYKLGRLDSALPYAIKLTKINGLNWPEGRTAYANNLLADIYSAMGEREKTFAYYRSALSKGFDFLGASSNEGIARLFRKEGRIDSALFYARRG